MRGKQQLRTNAIEALNAKLRRAVRTRGHFPTDEAAMKLLYLVVNGGDKLYQIAARKCTDLVKRKRGYEAPVNFVLPCRFMFWW